MLKFKILFFAFLIFCEFLPSQEIDISQLVREIESGDVDRANILIMSAEKGNLNSINLKYLKALLTKDADEAAKLYRDVIHSSVESEWKDDAVYRMYLFHYARGEFNESDKYARILFESFPESEYLSYIKRITKDLSIKSNVKNPDTTLTENKQRYLTTIDQTEVNSIDRFSIQVGAFSSMESAKNFANQFFGYSTRIIQKNVGGKILFAVLVGNFNSKEAASVEQIKIRDRFKVESIIVKLE